MTLSKKIYFFLALLIFWIGVINAFANDHELIGKVSMQGSILESTCSISMDSYDQSIEMGIIPMGSINQYGYGPKTYFSIQLINCHFGKMTEQPSNYFTLKFDGPARDNLFEVFGHAKGVALFLEDDSGQQIYPNKSIKQQPIKFGEANLKYGLSLVRNDSPLKAGKYKTIIKFKIDYN